MLSQESVRSFFLASHFSGGKVYARPRSCAYPCRRMRASSRSPRFDHAFHVHLPRVLPGRHGDDVRHLGRPRRHGGRVDVVRRACRRPSPPTGIRGQPAMTRSRSPSCRAGEERVSDLASMRRAHRAPRELGDEGTFDPPAPSSAAVTHGVSTTKPTRSVPPRTRSRVLSGSRGRPHAMGDERNGRNRTEAHSGNGAGACGAIEGAGRKARSV
jgi:hypothetical protein